jgi:multimeric flavodoxin WrbA
MQELKRLAKYYDIFVNSGKFTGAMELIMDSGGCGTSAFFSFDNFSEWLFSTTGQDHGISQQRQYALVLEFLTSRMGTPRETAGKILIGDFLRLGIERYLPECLRPFM